MNDIESRLLRNSVIDPATGCWVWIGYKTRNRRGVYYGRLSIRVSGIPYPFYVHRLAFEEWIESIRGGYEIDHKCRNTLCINPAHLQQLSKTKHRRVTISRAGAAEYSGVSRDYFRSESVDSLVVL